VLKFKSGVKKIYYCHIFLLITVIFFPLSSSGETESEIVNITICKRTVINNYFYGCGAETLPWLWTKENKEAGVNETDVILNLERIKEMELPITRIFVPWETWNPNLDYKTFTWGSDEMQSLYKTLDFYQRMGTGVILVTVDWFKESPWSNTQLSAQAVLGLLEYLVKTKGYTCIQFWTLTNEPELTYGWLKKLPFENYVRIHRLIKSGLKRKKIQIRIIGSDEVESKKWFKESVRSLYGIADIFSSHLYLYPQDILLISDYFKERLGIIKRASFAKRNTPFFLCEFGFRGDDFGSCSNSLMEDYEYGLYTADLCIEALNSKVSAVSLWCLYQIRLIDEVNPDGGKMMGIGLWAYKDKDWRPFPIFYLYSLFTKYIKSGSRILKVKVSPANILKVACVEHKGKYSLFILNATNREQRFLIEPQGLNLDLRKYIYSKSKLSMPHQRGLLMANGQVKVRGYLKDKIAASSVILYTNLKE
jgi:hypothetical protein